LVAVNVYQKVGILVMRLLGTLVTLVGLMGLAYFAVHLVSSSRDSGASPTDRGSGIMSLVWAAVGPLLVAYARPIGRRLGSGLD
jgi:hypothetical protein